MATQTRPFLTRGVALASAAAIAVATPAIAPNLTPTPTALSAAQVELATFADLLSITPADWSDYFFEGWGGAIGPIQVDPQTTEADYWIPQCNYDCTIPGISGLAYLALDALINGNGEGIDNTGGTILQNPDLPYQPDPTKPNYNPYINAWGTSALNYFFEGSFSTGLQYIAQSPFAPGAPLANEQIFNAIYLAFQGSYALTTLYLQALSTIAVLASSVPLVGEYVYRGIGSYIGPAFSTVDSVYDYSSYAGIPGILRYVSGVILSGGNPNPYPTAPPEPTAAVSAASVATPVVAALKADAPKAAVEAAQAEAVSSEDGAGSSEAGTEAPVADVEAPTAGDSAEADVSVTESTETPADTTAAVESPSSAVAETVAEAPARTAKRPVRNAVERATKKIASALGGATAGAAGGAAESGAATGGAAAGGAATGGAAAGGAADAGSDSAADSAADSDSGDSAR